MKATRCCAARGSSERACSPAVSHQAASAIAHKLISQDRRARPGERRAWMGPSSACRWGPVRMVRGREKPAGQPASFSRADPGALGRQGGEGPQAAHLRAQRSSYVVCGGVPASAVFASGRRLVLGLIFALTSIVFRSFFSTRCHPSQFQVNGCGNLVLHPSGVPAGPAPDLQRSSCQTHQATAETMFFLMYARCFLSRHSSGSPSP